MRRRRRGRLELREASASISPHEINKRRLGTRAGVQRRGYAAGTRAWQAASQQAAGAMWEAEGKQQQQDSMHIYPLPDSSDYCHAEY
ncbi:hypothetical protein OsI_03535 [Oryza sativa Indica Group]|uniref:Uncharacterized protein n=1 Tax=Oryza sativa subsp. indica TaxID=39946 RepID=A2WUI4_ORYSI|nr:hypothetical protein OsI_03535 [Oryza sativa Indica Group]